MIDVLQESQRAKLDPTDDVWFYSYPRFVTHVDENFIARLRELLRERLPAQGRILDLMSSWVSHLPEDVEYAHVEGHGLNEEELAANPRLDHYFVQDLNRNQQLPLPDQAFDAVLISVSVQYLQYPEAVFQELYRVLRPEGQVIVSFSNRMFFQKAIQAWRDGTDSSRQQLVKRYFMAVPGFSSPEVVAHVPANNWLSILGMAFADPFYAVIATRQS